MSRNGAGIYTLPAGSVIANGDTSDAADLNTPLADLEADMNTPRPVVAGGTGASTAADALVNLGLTATATQINAVPQLAGRNRIINGQGRINQRVYVSGTNTTGANQYTLDRWRVVTSGQNLTFTGNDAGRTMTAPAGGVEQVIEGANIEGGTYVLNWTGTATATVNGVARTKGETFTLPANTNATVRFISGTFTDVQLELGSVPTVFERLPLGDELARCQRYYWTTGASRIEFRAYGTAGAVFFAPFTLPVRMRGAVALGLISPNYDNSSSAVVGGASGGGQGAFLQATIFALGMATVGAGITADAEL